MKNKQWLKELAALLTAPGLNVLNRQRRTRAAKVIGTVYGPKRHKAASSCIDAMHALVKLSNPQAIVEGKTQPEIGKHCKLSGNQVGQYTRMMENLGLIAVERGLRVREGKRKGRFASNRYILLFLIDRSKSPYPMEFVAHPTPDRLYKMGVGWSSAIRAPT